MLRPPLAPRDRCRTSFAVWPRRDCDAAAGCCTAWPPAGRLVTPPPALGQDPGQKALGEGDAGEVDAVAEAGGDAAGHLEALSLERFAGAIESLDRHHWVLVAVDEQDRRVGLRLIACVDQRTGEADDAGDLPLAPRTDVEGHHRSLAEAHQRQAIVGEAVTGELGADERVEDGRRA